MKAAGFLAVAVLSALVPPPSGAAASARAFTDAQIVGIVGVANQGELDAGALAAGKTQNADVKKFSEHMTKDHGDVKQELVDVESKARLTPAESELSINLTKHASDEAGQLGYLTGDVFDDAYIDAQVGDHSMLLKELDEDLIPSAKDASVAAFLRKLRPVVAHHLAKARSLQAEFARRKK